MSAIHINNQNFKNKILHSDKPVLLDFWAPWCGPCQMEMPDFHEKYLELGEEIHFLMVNMISGRETLESAKTFLLQRTGGSGLFDRHSVCSGNTHLRNLRTHLPQKGKIIESTAYTAMM